MIGLLITDGCLGGWEFHNSLLRDDRFDVGLFRSVGYLPQASGKLGWQLEMIGLLVYRYIFNVIHRQVSFLVAIQAFQGPVL